MFNKKLSTKFVSAEIHVNHKMSIFTICPGVCRYITDSQEHRETQVGWRTIRISSKRRSYFQKVVPEENDLRGAAAEGMFTYHLGGTPFQPLCQNCPGLHDKLIWSPYLEGSQPGDPWKETPSVTSSSPVSTQLWAWHPLGTKLINKWRICE